MWVFPKIAVPQNGWIIMENPIKMDDLWKHPCWSVRSAGSLQFIFDVRCIPWAARIVKLMPKPLGKWRISGVFWYFHLSNVMNTWKPRFSMDHMKNPNDNNNNNITLEPWSIGYFQIYIHGMSPAPFVFLTKKLAKTNQNNTGPRLQTGNIFNSQLGNLNRFKARGNWGNQPT